MRKLANAYTKRPYNRYRIHGGQPKRACFHENEPNPKKEVLLPLPKRARRNIVGNL